MGLITTEFHIDFFRIRSNGNLDRKISPYAFHNAIQWLPTVRRNFLQIVKWIVEEEKNSSKCNQIQKRLLNWFYMQIDFW